MANLEVIALNPATPQLRAPGAGDGYLFPRQATISLGTITTNIDFINASVTWNNAAVNFSGIVVNAIDGGAGAYGGGSSLIKTQFGGVDNFKINASGTVYSDNFVDLASGSSFNLNTSGLSLKVNRRLLAASQSFYMEVDNGSGTKRGFQGATLRTIPVTVGTLTAPVVALQGARAFVTDATLGIIAGLGTVVAGGGANAVPVYCDGTNWVIG